jgi:hypothetical protein
MASRIFDMAQLSSWRDSVPVVVDDSVELLGMLLLPLPGVDSGRDFFKVVELE